MSIILTLNLIVSFLATGKRRKTQSVADKNETQNFPEQVILSREDRGVVSSIPNIGWDNEVVAFSVTSFFFSSKYVYKS
jgi:hypothetical protein